jgi:histone H3/H4
MTATTTTTAAAPKRRKATFTFNGHLKKILVGVNADRTHVKNVLRFNPKRISSKAKAAIGDFLQAFMHAVYTEASAAQVASGRKTLGRPEIKYAVEIVIPVSPPSVLPDDRIFHRLNLTGTRAVLAYTESKAESAKLKDALSSAPNRSLTKNTSASTSFAIPPKKKKKKSNNLFGKTPIA